MKSRLKHFISAAVLVALFAGSDWRAFRGTDGTGSSDEKNLPTQFDETHNVAWKAPLPGRGPSSPIVVGDRVIVTCSSGVRQDRLHVLCFNAASGKLRWQRQLWATGHTVNNAFGGVAAPTPASDGRLVFAFYSSNDLACFDLEGNLKWFRGLAYDYPATRNDVGMASSPVVSGDTVIVQCQTPAESFAAGLDTANGETRWRHEREHGAIWSSPVLLRGKTPDEDVVLMHSRSMLTAHNARSGEHLWDFEASCHTVASSTVAGETIYLPALGLHALRYDRTTGKPELLWYENRLRSGNSSPVVSQGRVYVVKSPAILVCGDAADGRVLWQLRLTGPQWGTPVVADGHLYCVNHLGQVQVVALGEEGRLVGTSQIDPDILASPAVADGALYFRNDSHLWKVAFDKAAGGGQP